MSWQQGLLAAGALYIAFLVALCWIAKPRKPFVPYKQINRYRITPDFRVGGDAKGASEWK